MANSYSTNWVNANAAMNAETMRRLREKTWLVGREWMVVSVPGSDDGAVATFWYAMNRKTHKCSRSFHSYDEALAETRKRNGLTR